MLVIAEMVSFPYEVNIGQPDVTYGAGQVESTFGIMRR
jgi:hypothetical protein